MKGFDHLFDRHKDETCLIIGNGPSLKDVPNSFLKKFPSFGSNRIYLKFTPTYYVAVNPLVIEQNMGDILHLKCDAAFVREGCFGSLASSNGTWFYELHSMAAPMFSYNPSAYVYEGHTVTFVSMQLAFFMGFRTVLLVGVDHRYEYQGEPNEENVWFGEDPNHFDPSYFRGHAWHNPDLERSEAAYMMAREAFDRDGRQIINLTEGSALEVFEKQEFKTWQV
jgi:hypothetical protein